MCETVPKIGNGVWRERERVVNEWCKIKLRMVLE